MTEISSVANGVAKPCTEDDVQRDMHGFTHPNLHRRVDAHIPEDPREKAPRSYTFSIYDDIHSNRTTEIHYHDEESEVDEIP